MATESIDHCFWKNDDKIYNIYCNTCILLANFRAGKIMEFKHLGWEMDYMLIFISVKDSLDIHGTAVTF